MARGSCRDDHTAKPTKTVEEPLDDGTTEIARQRHS